MTLASAVRKDHRYTASLGKTLESEASISTVAVGVGEG